jgi:hypothetical protein
MASPRELAGQRRGVIPRHVRVVARPCCVRALNARTHVRGQARAGVLERGGPRPRGRLALERGGPRPRGTSLRYLGGPRGPPRWRLRCARVLGASVDSWFTFFAGFKRVSPGYLGDPYGCPRHRGAGTATASIEASLLAGDISDPPAKMLPFMLADELCRPPA